ncbi:hypothetical protein PCASD_25174 [Puccinia coronata f. sp. avenae]|uniref:Uncharacterized protein n=1 Tax=Puccinia coronata f. sp. avenae TaxID=200324 RepID=A0A2N5S1E7_9BASI|nr:hypothetical protein PCASD_25174 [Puccinia coronata f. sp. avenae]
MDQEQPARPVAETIASFRAINPDGKSPEEYQKIFKTVIQQISHRVATRKERIHFAHMNTSAGAPPNDMSEFAQQLCLAILPSFQHKLRFLPHVLNPSNMRSDMRSWFEGVLNHLFAMHQILEEIDSSIISIRKAWERDQDDKRNLRHLRKLKARKIMVFTEAILTGPFCDLLNTCNTFFNCSNLSTLSLFDSHFIHDEWDKLSRRSTLTVYHIDTLIHWSQKSMLNVAKEEWRERVEAIEELLESLVECLHRIYLKNPKCSASESDQDIRSLSGPDHVKFSDDDHVKFFKDGVLIIKLCRIFFNKLGRITNSQPVIWVEPSTEMELDQLNQLLKVTSATRMYMYQFDDALPYPTPIRRETVVHALNKLQMAMSDCHGALDKYCNSLLETNNPELDHELIADGRLWLQSWDSSFRLVTEKAVNATGR